MDGLQQELVMNNCFMQDDGWAFTLGMSSIVCLTFLSTMTFCERFTRPQTQQANSYEKEKEKEI